MANVVQLVKQAALEAVEASKPLNVVYGTVISPKPLKIKIDQKITLTEEFLTLTRNVTDYETEVTVEWTTEDRSGGGGDASFASHNHEVKGKKKIKVHNALKTGEKVILLREQGGQNYIVLDRVGE